MFNHGGCYVGRSVIIPRGRWNRNCDLSHRSAVVYIDVLSSSRDHRLTCTSDFLQPMERDSRTLWSVILSIWRCIISCVSVSSLRARAKCFRISVVMNIVCKCVWRVALSDVCHAVSMLKPLVCRSRVWFHSQCRWRVSCLQSRVELRAYRTFNRIFALGSKNRDRQIRSSNWSADICNPDTVGWLAQCLENCDRVWLIVLTDANDYEILRNVQLRNDSYQTIVNYYPQWYLKSNIQW